jgi:hypothetical protein
MTNGVGDRRCWSGSTRTAGRLGGAAVEVAPPDAGWTLRHRRMHLLQVSSRCIAAGAEQAGIAP